MVFSIRGMTIRIEERGAFHWEVIMPKRLGLLGFCGNAPTHDGARTQAIVTALCHVAPKRRRGYAEAFGVHCP